MNTLVCLFLCSSIVALYASVCVVRGCVHISLSLRVGGVLNHCHGILHLLYYSLHSKT